jgi:hypothetical protein
VLRQEDLRLKVIVLFDIRDIIPVRLFRRALPFRRRRIKREWFKKSNLSETPEYVIVLTTLVFINSGQPSSPVFS